MIAFESTNKSKFKENISQLKCKYFAVLKVICYFPPKKVECLSGKILNFLNPTLWSFSAQVQFSDEAILARNTNIFIGCWPSPPVKKAGQYLYNIIQYFVYLHNSVNVSTNICTCNSKYKKWNKLLLAQLVRPIFIQFEILLNIKSPSDKNILSWC